MTETDYSTLRINAERLKADFNELSEIGATIYGGISRLSLSNEDLQARAWLDRRFQEAGLQVHDDDAGNLSGVLPSSTPDAKTLLMGSHLDTVPDGGRYDGAIGVLGALECLRTIKEAGLALPVHLEAINFTDDEGCWLAHLGSHALTGTLNDSFMSDREHDYGPFRAALYRAGIPPTKLQHAKRDPHTLAGYLELHIEQSARLFEAGCDIGVVTNIAGHLVCQMMFHGHAFHSGTTPLTQRRDALLGATTFVVNAYRMVQEEFPEGIFNCSDIETTPGAFNMTPEHARVEWECRHPNKDQIAQMEQRLLDLAREVAATLQLDIRKKCEEHTLAIAMAGRVVLAVEQACKQLNICSMRLTSYAGHDAQIMSDFTPSGLIFVPSVGGISHSPREFTEWRHVVQGVDVLLQTALRLAFETSP